MTKSISLIIVHYHTPDLLFNMLNSFSAHYHEVREYSFEFIIVNNGGDPDIVKSITLPGPIHIISPEGNSGYAGGVNLGALHSSGDILFLMNADLLFHSQSLVYLLRSLEEADIAGPQFYWESRCRIYLPPTEPYSFIYNLMKVLSDSGEFFLHILQKLWRKYTYRHILTSKAIESYQLSGAMLGIRRTCWLEVGPFDEQFKLYFEEVDWLLRARKQGFRAVFQPKSKVTHLYNQSSKKEQLSRHWFEKSSHYFAIKHHHWVRRKITGWIQKNIGRNSHADTNCWERIRKSKFDHFKPLPLSQLQLEPGDTHFLEISVFKNFVPSAISVIDDTFQGSDWILPNEVWKNLEPGTYYFRIVDSNGRKLLP